MSDKPKFPREVALPVALELSELLKSACLPERLMVCGSLRRNRDRVSDVEILYVSKSHPVRDGLFDAVEAQEVDGVLMCLLSQGVIKKRKTKRDTSTWGPFNKLAVHTKSGVPVDFFAATEDNWWNQVVCRTGSAENNIRIAAAARKKKMKWHPYGHGFTDARHGMGELIPVRSEEDVFRIVGLPYLEPSQR